MQNYKRQTFKQDTDFVDDNRQKLQTLGMRIRQSISVGYKLPSDSVNNSNAPKYMNNYEQQQAANNMRRVQLPNHLSNAPPPLDYNGSTMSDMSGWENEINHGANAIQSLETYYDNGFENVSVKRKRNDQEDQNQAQDQHEEQFAQKKDLNDFVSKYGPLSFHEEF